MKTPCLKCGLIHEEPTAICDGYAGIDPDETAGDSRKQAAARIRAILSAVPIESRRGGRARAAAAAGAGASSSAETPQLVTGRAEPAPPEVPEWRREVTERLESYRNRRERQRNTNQSVLAFRVHSKSETLEAAPAAELTEPAIGEPPAADSSRSSPAPAGLAAAPAGMEASAATAPAPPVRRTEPERTYQPVEEADLTGDLEGLDAEVSAPAPSSVPSIAATATSAASEKADCTTALPIAAEPSIVLADSATLEAHADPAELADAQRGEASAEPALMESAAVAPIPAIDTEYWHATVRTDAEELECGSLTSGFDLAAPEPENESALAEAPAATEPAHGEESVAGSESETRSPAAIAEAPAASAASEFSTAGGPDGAVAEAAAVTDPSEASDEADSESRRGALRTAAGPFPGAAPERIEIRVPQPVFDFSPRNAAMQQPQVEVVPVADLRERRCAAFLDAAILGFTLAGFFLAFRIAGGEFAYSRAGAAVSLAAAFLIYAQYVLLFTVVGGATPGMVLRGLRVVGFDGKAPSTAELAWRSFGYLLSAAAAMLGFVWSAWDEHGLSWHDRISQSYITYTEQEPLAAAVTAP